ncbi:unnamed protein product, partial [Ixodes persulcatus]
MAIDSSLQTAKEKAAALFIGCMDRDSIEELGLEPLRNLFSLLGIHTLPITLANRKTLDVSGLAGQVMSTLNLDSFVAVTLLEDAELREPKVLTVSPPGIFLERSMLEDNALRMSWYQGLIARAFYILTKNEESSARLAEDIFNLEHDIALAKTSHRLHNLSELFTRVPVKNLEYIPQWSWVQFFSKLLRVESSALGLDTYVLVDSVEYLKELHAIFGNTSKSTLLEFVAWRVLRAVAPLLPEPLLELGALLSDDGKPGAGFPPSLASTCYRVFKRTLGFAFGVAYMEDHFTKNTQSLLHKVKLTLSRLQDNIYAMANRSGIMDAGMISVVATKVGFSCFGCLHFLRYDLHPTIRKDQPSGLQQCQHGSEEPLRGKCASLGEERLLEVGTGTSRRHPDIVQALLVGPAIVAGNAFILVNPCECTINIYPFLMTRPSYMSDFGFQTARQILLSIFSGGKRSWIDDRRHFRLWWSNIFKSAFSKRSYCYIKQYDKYSKIPMNVSEFLETSILDNLALHISHKTYNQVIKESRKSIIESDTPWRLSGSNLTSEQLFFYGFASKMCEALSSRADYDRRMLGPLAPPVMRL